MLNVENRIQYMITFNSNVMIRNLFLLVVFLGCVSLRHVEAAIDIVPKPVKLVETDGRGQYVLRNTDQQFACKTIPFLIGNFCSHER